jgi:hypothetical protein
LQGCGRALSLSLSLFLSLTGERVCVGTEVCDVGMLYACNGAHTFFTGQREREKEREKKREREREM